MTGLSREGFLHCAQFQKIIIFIYVAGIDTLRLEMTAFTSIDIE